MKSKAIKTKSLYIHIPFCKKKCYFCSFVISVGSEHYADDYLACLNKEAQRYRGERIATLYIGGGTPSRLQPNQLKQMIDFIKHNFKFSRRCEFTIEVNPDDIDVDKARCIKDLGINRVSLGAQSFNQSTLKYLGRTHSSSDNERAFRILRKVGFRNINLDLIYGFPHQTPEEIKNDVRRLTELESEHVSLYTLTIEEKSRFHIKKIQLPSQEIQAKQYVLVKKLLQEAHFHQYEVSNFAKKGKESKHNLIYWSGGNYIGLGVGAHSHLDGRRFWNVSGLHPYMRLVKNDQQPLEGQERLTSYEQFLECLCFGLRMNKGVDLLSLEKRFHCVLDKKRRELVDHLTTSQYLRKERHHLKATNRGQLVLDEICARLI
ncbi:MAG: radical SAM family heme chaperone HemW [Candidatus Omnitrophota bacterium]